LVSLMTESDEHRKKVDTIIGRVSEREGLSWDDARTMVHKYVCGGKCDWYRTKSTRAGFDRHDLRKGQENLIEETVKEVMKGPSTEEAKWHIHKVLCPGHPRPRPR